MRIYTIDLGKEKCHIDLGQLVTVRPSGEGYMCLILTRDFIRVSPESFPNHDAYQEVVDNLIAAWKGST